MPSPSIESPSNPKIKALVKLHKASHRRKEGKILIEGVRETARALAAGYPLQELYICEELLTEENGQDLSNLVDAATSDIPVILTGDMAFRKASLRESPDGVIAVAVPINRALEELNLSANPLIAVAERIEKPGNLGAMVRSVNGTGADGLVLCDPLVSFGNPNVIRNSMGAVFDTALAEAPSGDLKSYLVKRNIKSVIATPDADLPFWDGDLTGPVAIIVGNEADGVSETWRDAADFKVSIPMAGSSDSLNAATSLTLLLYEALRQRHAV